MNRSGKRRTNSLIPQAGAHRLGHIYTYIDTHITYYIYSIYMPGGVQCYRSDATRTTMAVTRRDRSNISEGDSYLKPERRDRGVFSLVLDPDALHRRQLLSKKTQPFVVASRGGTPGRNGLTPTAQHGM